MSCIFDSPQDLIEFYYTAIRTTKNPTYFAWLIPKEYNLYRIAQHKDVIILIFNSEKDMHQASACLSKTFSLADNFDIDGLAYGFDFCLETIDEALNNNLLNLYSQTLKEKAEEQRKQYEHHLARKTTSVIKQEYYTHKKTEDEIDIEVTTSLRESDKKIKLKSKMIADKAKETNKLTIQIGHILNSNPQNIEFMIKTFTAHMIKDLISKNYVFKCDQDFWIYLMSIMLHIQLSNLWSWCGYGCVRNPDVLENLQGITTKYRKILSIKERNTTYEFNISDDGYQYIEQLTKCTEIEIADFVNRISPNKISFNSGFVEVAVRYHKCKMLMWDAFPYKMGCNCVTTNPLTLNYNFNNSHCTNSSGHDHGMQCGAWTNPNNRWHHDKNKCENSYADVWNIIWHYLNHHSDNWMWIYTRMITLLMCAAKHDYGSSLYGMPGDIIKEIMLSL